MKRKIAPYIVIDGKFDYVDVLKGLFTSFGNYPPRFDHGNFEHLPLEKIIPKKYKENDPSLFDGIITDDVPLVGIKKPIRSSGIGSERIISFPFKWARYVIECFKDFCESEGCAVYNVSTRQSDTPPPEEIAASKIKGMKDGMQLVRYLNEVYEFLGFLPRESEKSETVH